jgi:ferredoxin
MAELGERLAENATGRYYVDASCIDCDLCRNTAPGFFRRNDEIGLTVVYQQPVSAEELSQAEEARDGCPSDSIGNDGSEGPVAETAEA